MTPRWNSNLDKATMWDILQDNWSHQKVNTLGNDIGVRGTF